MPQQRSSGDTTLTTALSLPDKSLTHRPTICQISAWHVSGPGRLRDKARDSRPPRRQWRRPSEAADVRPKPLATAKPALRGSTRARLSSRPRSKVLVRFSEAQLRAIHRIDSPVGGYHEASANDVSEALEALARSRLGLTGSNFRGELVAPRLPLVAPTTTPTVGSHGLRDEHSVTLADSAHRFSSSR